MVKQDRAVRTRAAILTAAAEVFAEYGYARASIAQITERAGVTFGAVYFHFAGKEALAREIVLMQPERVTPPRSSRGLQRAVDTTLTWAHHLVRDPILLAGARLVLDQEDFVAPEENSHQQWTEIVAEGVAEAQQRGEVKPDVEPAGVARLVVNACTGAQMHAHLESGYQDLPERTAEMWRILLPTIATPKGLASVEVSEERGRVDAAGDRGWSDGGGNGHRAADGPRHEPGRRGAPAAREGVNDPC